MNALISFECLAEKITHTNEFRKILTFSNIKKAHPNTFGSGRVRARERSIVLLIERVFWCESIFSLLSSRNKHIPLITFLIKHSTFTHQSLQSFFAIFYSHAISMRNSSTTLTPNCAAHFLSCMTDLLVFSWSHQRKYFTHKNDFRHQHLRKECIAISSKSFDQDCDYNVWLFRVL